MELVYFNWKTNPDYFEMLNRPEIRTSNQIKKSIEKRDRVRKKRKRK